MGVIYLADDTAWAGRSSGSGWRQVAGATPDHASTGEADRQSV